MFIESPINFDRPVPKNSSLRHGFILISRTAITPSYGQTRVPELSGSGYPAKAFDLSADDLLKGVYCSGGGGKNGLGIMLLVEVAAIATLRRTPTPRPDDGEEPWELARLDANLSICQDKSKRSPGAAAFRRHPRKPGD
jgi:hypothetical protein